MLELNLAGKTAADRTPFLPGSFAGMAAVATGNYNNAPTSTIKKAASPIVDKPVKEDTEEEREEKKRISDERTESMR